ncbi:hypothetical protein IMG5_200050 [Ichthyophthirius multifiliis]|uniref:AB hydrolase-1 domain-containing protein n=1 Tax=Ichthyophthirius multifiliis TaxID=5932 RepID=G0R5P6_ICHMU|nr:hypothetical protein IMG5_200050 [Ichthyophthirius multifiliis]EGR27219.1 hypothetical protein IMG5_200050 [Ichthyophthirius multifiliis]|eukprot:XP_004024103.1 hypothetical protein IMG5_200050 [Ichthyophthirius multifiliis]
MALYGAKIDPTPYVPYEREYVKTQDGGQIALDWVPLKKQFQNEEDNKNKILMIMHGLTGASNSNYISQLALFAQKNGYRPVCINMRGYNSQLSNHQLTDFTKNDDLLITIDHIKQKFPQANLYAAGISMGANYLLKMAGQEQENCKLQAIVSISNPFDLLKCSYELKKWSKKIYDFNLTKNYIRNLQQNLDIFKQNEQKLGINLGFYLFQNKIFIKFQQKKDKILSAKTTEEYHSELTMKLTKHQNLEQMYTESSCAKYIKDIKVPTLCINSGDDYVCVPDHIPKDKITQNPNIIMVMTQRGGHIDYFTTYKCQRVYIFFIFFKYILVGILTSS